MPFSFGIMCWHASGAGALDFECLSIRCIPSWRFSYIFERLWIRCQHFPSEKRLRSGHPTISLSMGVFVSISATLRSLLSIPSHTPLDRSSEGRTVPFSRRRCRKPCLSPAKSRCPHSNRHFHEGDVANHVCHLPKLAALIRIALCNH